MKIIKLKLSEQYNQKELKYREEIQQTEEDYNTIEKWIKKINDGRRNYLKEVLTKVKIKGDILEIGAGSCWVSSELSKLEEVQSIKCLDFSQNLLTNIAPKIMKELNANTEKITLIIGDFHNLDFKKESFDYVIVDAALHHIENIEIVLNQIKKVLKKDGKIIAIREPFIPKLRPASRQKFGLHERQYGVIEKTYTKKEWKDMFTKSNFNIQFVPLIPGYSAKQKLIRKVPFKWLNGLLFAHYIIIAYPKRDEINNN